jgi:hypothetical protein
MRLATLTVAVAALVATAAAAGAGQYRDPAFGWTAWVGAGMHARPWSAQTNPPNQSYGGSIIANFRAGRTIRTGFTRFPANGAALVVWTTAGGPPPPPGPPPPDSRFPLSLRTFRPAPALRGPHEPILRTKPFVANGISFVAAVWFGPHATRRSKAAIARTVSSIRFPRA